MHPNLLNTRCLPLSLQAGSLAFALALMAAVPAPGQSTIENNNLISNGSFDSNAGTDWSWWTGGTYFYNDGPDSICSIGWWDGINLYRGTDVQIQAGVDYVITARARNGDGHGAGIFFKVEDATQGIGLINSTHFFPDEEHTSSTGPWHIFTSRVNAADLTAYIGDTLRMAVGMNTNAAWNEQYGWVHFDWIQLAPANPLFTSSPQNTTNYVGASASFSVTAVGAVTNHTGPGSTLQYQWYKGSGTPVTDATNSVLTFPSLAETDAGTYYAIATGPYGSSQPSDSATLVVLPANPPVLVTGPSSVTGYPHQTVQFTVQVTGTAPIGYQWKSNSVAIPGATSTNLVLTDISAASAATYSVLVTNRLGSINPSATLSFITPAAGSYEASIVEMRPVIYLRFSDIDNSILVPNEGTIGTVANGTAEGLYSGVDGPLPPAYPTLETTNRSVGLNGSDSDVAIPALNSPANVVTVAAWVLASGLQADYAGIVFERGGAGGASGLDVHPNSSTGFNTLAYHWAGDFWGYDSGLILPDSQWCFVALVVTPTNGTLYLRDPNVGTSSNSVNPATHNLCAFGGSTEIGWDNNGSASSRRFSGAIDEVMVFNRALSADEVNKLYLLAVAPPLTYTVSSGQLILQWTTGTLQSAGSVNGTFTDVSGASSPSYSVPLNGSPAKFFRLRR